MARRLTEGAFLLAGSLARPNSARPSAVEAELDQLFRAESASLLRYIRIVADQDSLAQEALQEAFLRYYVHRMRFDPPASPRIWLFRAARDFVLTAQKKDPRLAEVPLGGARQRPDQSASPEQMLLDGETIEMIFGLMAPRELECLRLRTEGFSYKEIAEILEIEPGTVGAMLARAASKISKAYASADKRCDTL